jgi:hypothetical protein
MPPEFHVDPKLDPMNALLRAGSGVRDGFPHWLKGAPTHVLAELLTALEERGWRLVPDGATAKGDVYVCPNGHPVESITMVACEAEGCGAYVAYEPSAHGMDLFRELEALTDVADIFAIRIEQLEQQLAAQESNQQ